MQFKRIPKSEGLRISLKQAEDHIVASGFFSRGFELVFLQFTDDDCDYVRWITVRDFNGRKVFKSGPEPERMLSGNVLDILNKDDWEMSAVVLEYT